MNILNFILRRGSQIEVIEVENRLAIPTLNANIPLSESDITIHGRLLALLDFERPVIIVDLPDNRLPAPLNIEAIRKGKDEGKEVTPQSVALLPHGVLLSLKDLEKALAEGRLGNESDFGILKHALIHAQGNVRLPKLTPNVGGDGPLLVNDAAESTSAAA